MGLVRILTNTRILRFHLGQGPELLPGSPPEKVMLSLISTEGWGWQTDPIDDNHAILLPVMDVRPFNYVLGFLLYACMPNATNMWLCSICTC